MARVVSCITPRPFQSSSLNESSASFLPGTASCSLSLLPLCSTALCRGLDGEPWHLGLRSSQHLHAPNPQKVPGTWWVINNRPRNEWPRRRALPHHTKQLGLCTKVLAMSMALAQYNSRSWIFFFFPQVKIFINIHVPFKAASYS